MSTENHVVTKILTLNEYNKLYDLKKNRWKGPCNKETEWCFKQKYNMSAGCDPWPMKNSKISLDGKFVSEGDDDLEPYFLVNTDDGVGYIYPYAFVALPTKSGGHHIVRMD